MKITLEVLKEKGASDDGIRFFEIYYEKDNKKELTPIEFIRKHSDSWFFCRSMAYKCVDTLEELKEIVDWTILVDWDGAEPRKTLDYTFEYCSQLYKQDLKLFKKAVEHHVNNDFGFKDIFEYCGEVLELLPELHKKLRELNLIKQSCFDVKNDIRKILNSL